MKIEINLEKRYLVYLAFTLVILTGISYSIAQTPSPDPGHSAGDIGEGTIGGALTILDGKVGIGDTTPVTELNVNGDAAISGNLDIGSNLTWAGDNSDSGYIRIGSLQICWGKDVLTGTTHIRQFSFDFPAPFSEVPVVTNGINADASGYTFGVYNHDITTTRYSGNLVEVVGARSSTTPVTMNYVAIGTWE